MIKLRRLRVFKKGIALLDNCCFIFFPYASH
jgi:hypothetical protein